MYKCLITVDYMTIGLIAIIAIIAAILHSKNEYFS